MRTIVFAIAVVFTVLLAYLTVLDFARHGVTAIGVLGVLIVVLFGVGFVGALRHPPHQ
jgi:lipopolysaccharide export LptBFGC system permease protein LptF